MFRRAILVLLFLPSAETLLEARDRCEGDCMNGTGRFAYEGGGLYVGDFRNGEPHGHGTYTLTNGRTLYRGEWRRGRPSGQGEFFLEDGRRYTGQFIDGRFEGRGVYTFPDGARYEGEFRAGFFEGRGIFTAADGTRTSGLFAKDRLIERDRLGQDDRPGSRTGSAESQATVQPPSQPGAPASDTADRPGGLVPGAGRPDLYLPRLRQKQVAVVANHTSVSGGVHIVTRLQRAGVDVQRIFTPEHGLTGSAGPGELIASQWSARFGLPVISLYHKKKRPQAKSLRDVDAIVYDVQDVGVRFYTYISTLHHMMDACAKYNIPLIVLDRPNPNGAYVDGPVLKTKYRSFVGMDPVPIVYGMTAGEYARMINGEGWLVRGRQCRLTVVPVAHYTHATRYDPPVRPSPNLPDATAIHLYPHLGLFEGTALSVGRGTPYPFKVFGHPDLPGRFEFTPQPAPGAGPALKLSGRTCRGVDLRSEPSVFTPGLKLRWLIEAYRAFPDRDRFFDADRFAHLAGGPDLMQQIRDGWSEEQIRRSWSADLERFKSIRKKYLLYP